MKRYKIESLHRAGETSIKIVIIILYVVIVCSLGLVKDFLNSNKLEKLTVFDDCSNFNRDITQLEMLCEKIAYRTTKDDDTANINEINNFCERLKRSIRNISRTDTAEYSEFTYLITNYEKLEKSILEYRNYILNTDEDMLNSIYSTQISPICYELHKYMYQITAKASKKLEHDIVLVSSYINVALATITLIYILGFTLYFIYHKKNKKQYKVMIYNNSLLETLSCNIDNVFIVRNNDNTANEYVSKNAKKVLGFDYMKLLKDDQLIIKQMPKVWRNRIQRDNIKNAELPYWHTTFQYLHPDTGELMFIEKRIFNVTVDELNNENKYIYVYENQTEMVKTQNNLQKALDDARTANKAKSRFLSNMSHDIRTPMHAIIGMTTLAQMNLQDTTKVEDCLSKIMTSSNHLLGLVSQILDMSRIESGKMTLNNQYFNLIHFINNIEDIVSPRIKSKNLCFIVDRSKLVTESVYGDELRLSQIIINFIDNATKYNKDNGTIRFTISENHAMKKGDTEITFEIKDTGCGMTEEFRKKIFEPFERDTIAENSNIEGTGLGMSISRNLINLMSGTVEVDSKVNVGTTIRIIIGFKTECSIETESAVTLEEKARNGLDISNKKILVVDDMEMNVNIVKGFLEKTKIGIESASSGEEAIEIISNSPEGSYDLIFLDIHMTGIDGYETCRRIRELDRKDTVYIPIVAITADAFTEDIKKAKEAGMNGHISKPFQINELLHVVREFIK